VRVSPLGGLALAAGLATIIFAAAEVMSRQDRSAGAAQITAARVDTVHVVRFLFVAPGASTVAVVGDFNQWDVDSHRLVPVGADGVWSASVPLTPGRHEYAFVIDGRRWVADPAAAASIADEFGGQSSVVTVGGPRPRAS
jgi:1,4-alpha-glucan branching enzyme